jgi:hypothetical protein
MKPLLQAFVCLFLFNSCANPSDKEENKDEEQPQTVLYSETHFVQDYPVGDVDGDGNPETATLTPPDIREDGLGCLDDSCVVEVSFGDGIPLLRYPYSIGGILEDLGDLNGDGRAELLYVPDWFQSCWGSFSVYQLIDGKWIQSGRNSLYWCEEDLFKERVQMIDDNRFIMVGETSGDGSIIDKVDTFTLYRATSSD